MGLSCKLFGHKWTYCKCSRCGMTRDEEHILDLCKGKCSICGKVQDEQHEWDSCNAKCIRCGKAGNGQHDWDGCMCSRCSATRDEEHKWRVDRKLCSKCGKLQAPQEKALNKLLFIFPEHVNLSHGDRAQYEAFDRTHRDEIRAIGKALNENGGMFSMLTVGEAFRKRMPIHARILEVMWSGIGGWQA